MKTSEQTTELYKALFLATKEIKTLKKESSGYGYKYLNLESLIDYLKPILANHGLFYIQAVGSTDEDCISLTTRLIDSTSGQWMESKASIPLTDMKSVNKSQAAGSAVTYLRRYSLTALFGIAENDNDGLTKDEIKIKNAEQASNKNGDIEPAKKEEKPLDSKTIDTLKKAWSFYSERGNTDKANFINVLSQGKKLEHLETVLKAYQADLVEKVMDGSKQLDKALEE